jgi:hypothetical protein
MNAIPSHLLISKFDMRKEFDLRGMELTAAYHLDLAAAEQREIDKRYEEIDANTKAAKEANAKLYAEIDERMKKKSRLKLIAGDWTEKRDYASQWAMPQAQ